MDVPNTMSGNAQDSAGPADTRRQNNQYPTRHTACGQDTQHNQRAPSGPTPRFSKGHGDGVTSSGYARGSPAKKDQKHVVFQLIDNENPTLKARLPMRVMISAHDTTDSIITTLKNFYGLYECGISFESEEGISLIAAYNNFENDMVVYVRVVAPPPSLVGPFRDSTSPKRPTLGPAFEMRQVPASAAHSPSRSAARSAGGRSMSPQSEVGQGGSFAAPGAKSRPGKTKSKDNSLLGDGDGYSSGENDQGSVTSSRRSKAEEIKADITVDNIVEGGRRKRAFESSELPLFVPPQVPVSASISSVSPQRRSGPMNGASPYANGNQHTFSYTQPLPSPQSYGGIYRPAQSGFAANPYHNNYQPPNRQLRGGRASGASYSSQRASNGVLPTPDPTVGSVISDEDVALQLMRLGDPIAYSHGRTSTSTVDDAFSGKADAASSGEEDDEDDSRRDSSNLATIPRTAKGDAGPRKKKQRLMNELPSDGTSGDEYEDHRDGTFGGESGEVKPGYDGQRKMSKTKNKHRGSVGPTGNTAKLGNPRDLSLHKAKKASLSGKMPMSPASLPTQSRKASVSSTINFQHQLGDDEDDLSSKPRCQRCRKSKKGCDRQRPCGRCKDAGIGADGCVSEDEGNGRKGRYGRHMGVTIKKGEDEDDVDADADVPLAAYHQPSVPANGYFLAPALPDKANKKRKR